jgi:ketosteroid isomerase-like protein
MMHQTIPKTNTLCQFSRFWLSACLASLMAAMSSSCCYSGSEAEIAAVKNLEARYVAVVDKSGIPFLERTVADDFTFTDTRGEVETKTQLIKDIQSATLTYNSIHLDGVNVRLWGDAAVTNGQVSIDAQYRGEHQVGRLQFTRTWIRRRDTGWELVAHHVSRIQ